MQTFLKNFLPKTSSFAVCVLCTIPPFYSNPPALNLQERPQSEARGKARLPGQECLGLDWQVIAVMC